MPGTDTWRLRARTGEALAGLVLARLAIALVPLSHWRGRVGRAEPVSALGAAEARKLAVHVRRAAQRLPIAGKCLPQALALGFMLQRRKIAHRLVIAARPAALREGQDDLHAWVECGEATVLGELPGEWIGIVEFP